MLKPKKGFLMAQLNIDRLTPLQWDGIMRAMDAYAEHYHEELSKLQQHTAISVVCEHKNLHIVGGIDTKCLDCGKSFSGNGL